MNIDDFEKKLHDIIEAKKFISKPFYYAVYVINGWPVTVQLFSNDKIKRILAGGHEIQDIDSLRELRPTNWKLSTAIYNSSATLPKFLPSMTETPQSPNDVFPGFPRSGNNHRKPVQLHRLHAPSGKKTVSIPNIQK